MLVPVGLVRLGHLNREVHLGKELGDALEHGDDDEVHEGDLAARHRRLLAVHEG